jgi:hypothetical protein
MLMTNRHGFAIVLVNIMTAGGLWVVNSLLLCDVLLTEYPTHPRVC